MTENVKQAAPKFGQCDEVALFCGTAAVFLTTDQAIQYLSQAVPGMFLQGCLCSRN